MKEVLKPSDYEGFSDQNLEDFLCETKLCKPSVCVCVRACVRQKLNPSDTMFHTNVKISSHEPIQTNSPQRVMNSVPQKLDNFKSLQIHQRMEVN
jgi:hypothetical protein